MRPPIIAVLDDTTLEIYESAAAIEGDIELPGADGGLVRAFDSEGRLLVLEVPPESRPAKPARRGVYVLPLRLRATEAAPTHAPELRGVLVEALASHGLVRQELESRTLSELVTTASAEFGMTGVRRTTIEWLRDHLGSRSAG